MNTHRLCFLTILISAVVFYACRPDTSLLADTSAKLKFSSDTLRFDTVFTNIGSATRFFKVVNTFNKPLRINKISVSNKTGIGVKLNIDGVVGKVFSNVDVPANDSIYVFAEVTIDPNAALSASPFIANEYINFELASGTQSVVIEAWGQNAIYIPSQFAKGGLALLSAGNPERVITFDDKKPYVIYGVLFVDSCILRIAAGTHIYVHGGLGGKSTGDFYRDGILYLLPNAHLEVNGTADKPVIFEGDRLESEFIDLPDQWAGIIIGSKSSDNILNYTTIRNSRVGIRMDSASSTTLKNCRFYNTSGSAIVAIHSRLTAENCLSYNTSNKNVELTFGGDYTFNFCTFSSVGSRNTSLYADNKFCYTTDNLGNCTAGKLYRLNLNVTNTIFYGSKLDELSLNNYSPDKTVPLNYTFTNCLVRATDTIKRTEPDFFNKCTNCVIYKSGDKLFKNTAQFNYNLDTLSIAQYKGAVIPSIIKDIVDKPRDTKTPDIGCFERYPR